MPTKEEVGRRVRLARFRRDLTLKEVAARSGMSATHISEIERGKTSPTIGALEKIASALEERPAHFVEEKAPYPAALTRKSDRTKHYTCDARSKVVEIEVLTQDVPWGTTFIFRKSGKPGDQVVRQPVLGEMVAICVRGMVRFTVGDEDYVIRDGDTIQFPLDQGYAAEVLGDDKAECLCMAAFIGRRGW